MSGRQVLGKRLGQRSKLDAAHAAAGPWSVPAAPDDVEQAEPVTVTEVVDATLTPFRRGRLHTPATFAAKSWMTGAVYDGSGRLVPSSQRLWRGDPRAAIAADPAEIRVPEPEAVLSDRWLYMGHWSHHFGHFLLELVTNLWPAREEMSITGLVAHRAVRTPAPAVGGGGMTTPQPNDWQREMLALTGYGDLELRVVRHKPVRVETLVIPSRPLLLKSWALPEAVGVWRRMSEAVRDRGSDRMVFLSRSRFHALHPKKKRVRAIERWDVLLDDTFAAAGFAVVHPQELSFTEQVRIVRGAEVLAGASGSALHLSALAAPGTRVLEIGDLRNPDHPLASQRMIDAACGHRSAFVPYHDEAGLAAVLEAL
ncbi:glycosyltransferase 61 family protein [Nocardioides sp. HM23]|uniref:glycosyltransferase family 61 protein n=1 Tax=Nocardioides bizhenqiangii TaxID=3095076 RepID=UPI002ACA90D4|nr:glycosyltransferase 61 family protein [Nocardioides sp. HM23]MDZ5623129.1 glycosyltransferase 61 family protein [Nocardioides sp. HM23]